MSTRAKGTALYDVLNTHAENGWVCPSIPKLALLCGIEKSSVSTYLLRLRKSGKITSWLVNVRPFGQARIVTIAATGKSTAMPQPTKRYNKPAAPAFTPIAGLTSAGRFLTGPEFEARAAELMARDTEERRKREMTL